MSNPYRDALADLYAATQLYTGLNPAAVDVPPAELVRRLMEAMAASADLLTQPEPPELTDETLLRLAARAFGYVFRDGGIVLAFARAAIAADHARWGGSTPHLEPESAATALAARPLMAKVAAIGDRIGRHTVGEIIAISDQAAAWLTANPPGVSSCVEPQPPADGEVAQLQRRLKELAHAATMEDWREFDMRVPAEPLRDADLVLTRAADLLQRHYPQPVAVAERPWEREGWCDDQGRCWIFMPDISTSGRWRLTDSRDVARCHTHSLPASALPIPDASNA